MECKSGAGFEAAIVRVQKDLFGANGYYLNDRLLKAKNLDGALPDHGGLTSAAQATG